MSETRKLIKPGHGGAPPLIEQVLEICSVAMQESGGYLVEHPEENSFIVVFGGHEVAVTISNWDIKH